MSTALHESGMSGVEILDRVIQTDDSKLTPGAARSLLSLKFQKTDERRMDRLAAKARKGTLTDRERFEADQYNLVSHMLALLQAKARLALKRRRRSASA